MPIGTCAAGAAIRLGRGSLRGSSSQPGRSMRNAPAPFAGTRRPYSALLRVGFAVRAPLPTPRCALAAPFHPYLCPLRDHRRSALCGTFPRPISEDTCRAGVTRHPRFVEPGLSSTGSLLSQGQPRLPGPLANAEIGARDPLGKVSRQSAAGSPFRIAAIA